MEDILVKIVNKKKERIAELGENYTVDFFKSKTDYTKKVPSFYEAMKKDGLSIIGEVKKASPSKGIIREKFIPVEIAKEYDQAVDAMSVLTEEHFFLGKPEYLKEIAENTNIPLLRKDFIINPVQIYEAKYLGASCVLLITSILSLEKLKEFLALTKELGLDALVETHTEEEVKKALEAGADIIGVNNRNLKTFDVSLETTVKLSKLIPKNKILISESGIFNAEDIKYLKQANINGILVGESFMRSTDINKLAKDFKVAFE